MYGYLLEELWALEVARGEGVELARRPIEQARGRGLSIHCKTLETYAETSGERTRPATGARVSYGYHA